MSVKRGSVTNEETKRIQTLLRTYNTSAQGDLILYKVYTGNFTYIGKHV